MGYDLLQNITKINVLNPVDVILPLIGIGVVSTDVKFACFLCDCGYLSLWDTNDYWFIYTVE